MAYKFLHQLHDDELPKDVLDFLLSELKSGRKARGDKFKGPIFRPADSLKVGSELLAFPDPHIENLEMLSGAHWRDSSLFKAGVPDAYGGEGLKIYGEEPEFPSELAVLYNKVNDRTLARKLSGVLATNNYLLLGQDVFDILNSLSPIPRWCWAKIPVEFKEEDRKTIGHLIVYDPPFVANIVDWRCSETRWTRISDSKWNYSPSFTAARYSTSDGHNCLIARSEWREHYFISKDFYYTLHKAGVHGAKKLYRDPFKTYHNYDYVPSNLKGLSND